MEDEEVMVAEAAGSSEEREDEPLAGSSISLLRALLAESRGSSTRILDSFPMSPRPDSFMSFSSRSVSIFTKIVAPIQRLCFMPSSLSHCVNYSSSLMHSSTVSFRLGFSILTISLHFHQ